MKLKRNMYICEHIIYMQYKSSPDLYRHYVSKAKEPTGLNIPKKAPNSLIINLLYHMVYCK